MRTLVVALALTLGCFPATEIQLEITTDEPCSIVSTNGVVVLAGTDTIETHACTGSGDVGSLVVVPNGSLDASVDLTVMLGVERPAKECDPQNPVGCIVARRTLRYVSHHALHLPIELRGDCLDVPCPAGETCNHRACVSSTIDGQSCPSDTCGDSQLVTASSCGGVDCSGGTCNGGICSLSGTATPPTLFPGACIAVASDGVYFTSGASVFGFVYFVPRVGGTPMSVLSASGSALGIAASGSNVYAVIGGTVWDIKAKAIVMQPGTSTGALAADGTTVCAALSGSPGAIQCSGAFGAVNASTSGSLVGSPSKLTMAGGVEYSSWSDSTLWTSCYNAMCGINRPAHNLTGTPDGVAIGAPYTLLYFTVWDGASTGGVGSVDLANGDLVAPVVTTSLVHPHGLAVDPALGKLYIADEAGTIWSAPVMAPSTPTPIATGQTTPDCLAMDAAAVYWLSGNMPMKAAR